MTEAPPPPSPAAAAPGPSRRLVQVLVVLASLGLLAWLLWRDADQLRQVRLEAPLWLVADPVLLVVNMWAVAKANQVLLRALDVRLQDGEAFALLTISRLGNLLGPLRAGAAARGAYLHKKHKVPLTHFLAQLGALQLIFMTLAAIAALAVSPWLAQGRVPSVPLLVAQLGLVAGSVVLLAWRPVLAGDGGGAVVRRVRLVLEGWEAVRRNRRLLLHSTVFVSLQLICGSLMFWCEFRAFGYALSLPGAIYINAAQTLEGALGITPAGLGIREALVAMSASAIGAPGGLPVAVSLLRRAIVLVTVGLLTPWATNRLAIFR